MTEIKQIYSNLQIPAPSAGFEDRIISAALSQKKSASVFNFKAYAAACIAVFLIAGIILFPNQRTEATDYAMLIDGSAIIDESDIYDDLI